ncbi:hypothetical protein [Oceanobacillus bengalensis]|uniref:Uncharacterized protein n=1 Tax=Oceanobacillus bengalensis TaxID=1435466 RepID=A0A494Z2U3_9BACI|nr:hypothetical protein [Oceanobacillus bengalensis]RKQ16846.1 hypothetical protein D8M05_06220 [Oceanobacillus bengalensis]
MGQISIVLANAHMEQLKDEGIQRELRDVQTFFDANDFPFKDGTVNFVILRGLYNHIEKIMTIVGVFVNKTGKTIDELKGTVAFDLAEEKSNAKFAELDFHFQSNFLGKLEKDSGFIIHIQVPASGLDKNKDVYNATELTGEVKGVEINTVGESNNTQ